MPTPPAGAQRSDDGHYWWDESTNQWQLVEDDTATAAAGAGGAQPADPAAAGGDEWPPAGYPADPADWTDEQLQYWFGNTQDTTEPVALGGDPVTVVAIADLDATSNEGLA